MQADWFKSWGSECVQKIPTSDGRINEVATLNCIPAIFSNILSALLAFAGLTALIMFIIGGFKFMNAAGDPKKISAADNNFKFGIIGLSIVMASFLLISLISIVTGVHCITKFGFGCQ